MNPLNLSIIQHDILWESVNDNLSHIDQLIQNNVSEESRIVILPEMFATGFSMRPQSIAETMDGTICQWMRNKSKAIGKIICGSVAISENGNFYNRLIWMMPNGHYYHYDKAHLFGKANEDKHYKQGDKRVIVSVNGWRFLLITCYDIRFPVWCRQSKELYDGIICVANWPEVRIDAWNALLCARAIENQSYVIAANRVGEDGNGYYHNGDSQLITPNGEVVDKISHSEGVLNITLNEEIITTFRKENPFLEDRDEFILM